MRQPAYIFSDGERVHFHYRAPGDTEDRWLALPAELVEDLACMVWHRLAPEQQDAIKERVSVQYAGEFGADGVLAAMGQETALGLLRRAFQPENPTDAGRG